MNSTASSSRLLAGRYHLERVLGSGGMGRVYRARDLLHEQLGEPCSKVAIKLLDEPISQCPDAHVLLYREFALARSLRHERVVRVFSFEVDTHSHVAFFTMELLQGVTLDRLLLECPYGLPWRELRPIALQLLDALVYTHQQDVLHGDVKPANVMVGEEGVRLFDFGLGHAQAEAAVGLPSVSRSRFNAWTPAYAAPELLAGGALTAAADLYGVACILYELAHGSRVGKRAFTDRLPRPAQLPRHCWAALQAALAIDPQHRSITVAELRHVMGRNRARWCM
ncbi:serine/threonine protein kinase [Pseudomonas lactis]|uniref:Protein kinase n=1 Tax=Pseudomonas lactis TaxID=1615674 RepID=I4KB00_9PSED|nr:MULTISPECIES: serine/threonine-protein kinase [Pseudomonas]MBD8560761.1 serine/threonine protein kinase [Pseudomonas fluorescens]ATN12219.1 serine/threonine protein kinase [Pseudomonas sp. FDAARGOS_380]EIK61890.1 serine/threonine protein kinase Stk1 [Pseudomonas lactis]MBI6976693.1 serine/threonine protein kinase [Pseudomonas lactis]MCF4974357.1 protein kinase [Pseudomonas lactis]